MLIKWYVYTYVEGIKYQILIIKIYKLKSNPSVYKLKSMALARDVGQTLKK